MDNYEKSIREVVQKLFRINTDSIKVINELAFVQIADCKSCDDHSHEYRRDASVFRVRLVYKRKKDLPIKTPIKGLTTLEISWSSEYKGNKTYKYSACDLQYFSWRDNIEEYDFYVLTEAEYKRAVELQKSRSDRKNLDWIPERIDKYEKGAATRIEKIRKNHCDTDESLKEHIYKIAPVIVRTIWHSNSRYYPIIIDRGTMDNCPKPPFHYNWVWNEEDRKEHNKRFSPGEDAYCNTQNIYACIAGHWITLW